MFLIMLWACGNKELPAVPYVLPPAAIPLMKEGAGGMLVRELEPVQLAEARDKVALMAALERFQIGDQYVDVQVVTGITDASDVGTDGWRSCAGFDPWLLIDLKPEDHLILFSNHLKPCEEDPDGYVVAFVAAVPLRGLDEPRPLLLRGERIGLAATDTRTVRVEWLVMYNESLLP